MDLRSQIQKELTSELPGKLAHLKMAPDASRLDYVIPQYAIPAAVMLLIYQKEGLLKIPLIKRMANNEHDRHKGQISFPGGKKDLSDQTLAETAVRECSEEIGVRPENIQMLGALSSLYIPVSGFHVYPFVAWHTNEINFERQESEVESILEIPLDELMKSSNRDYKVFQFENGPERTFPILKIQDEVIWGATAMILEEFCEVFKKLNPS